MTLKKLILQTLFIALLISFSNKTFARINLTKNTNYKNSFSYFISNQDIDIEDITTLNQNFTFANSITLKGNKTLWVKFEVYNQTKISEWILDIQNYATHIDLYCLKEDGVHHSIGGGKVPFSERTIYSSEKQHVNFNIAPNKHSTIFLKVKHTDNPDLHINSIKFKEQKYYTDKVIAYDWPQGVFLGIFLILSIIGVIGVISFKDKSYLYYVVTVLMQAIFFLQQFNYLERFIFYDSPILNNIPTWFLNAGMIFYTLFIYKNIKPYLNAKSFLLNNFKWIISLYSAIIIAGLFLLVKDYSLYVIVSDYIVLVNVIFILLISIKLLLFKKTFLKLLGVGSLCMNLGGLAVLILYFGEPGADSYIPFQTGMVIEYLFFIFAFVVKYNYNENIKREQLIKEMESQYKYQMNELVTEKLKLEFENRDNTNQLENTLIDSVTQNKIREKKAISIFYKKLQSVHNNLSKNDLELCLMIHQNLSSKEIASRLDKEVNTIEVARYRLRKKIQLKKGVQLNNYLKEIIEQ